MVVKFNSDGDAPGSYDIFQYQKVDKDNYFTRSHENTRFDYVSIGEWNNERYVHLFTIFKGQKSYHLIEFKSILLRKGLKP